MSHLHDSESSDEAPVVVPGDNASETDGVFVTELGEFHLLRKLGRGGMADVYLAEQTSLKRKVALKVLRPELLADDSYLERFAREAKAAAGLNHVNIVQVYAVGAEDGLHYIAQEFVQGMNLREFLTRKGPPDAAAAIHIIRQVAAALQAAAEAGIVHRDIKPENILLTRQGVVKVTDFGLAQLNQDTDPTHLTQVGTTMGTPLYMSPEQVNGARVDHRSDIYSLGITCYHLLAGQPPFRGETAISVAVQHVNKAPQPLANSRSDLPRRLCDLVHRMMAKNPDERLSDATSVLLELDSLQQRLKLPRGTTVSEWSDYEPPLSFWVRATNWLPDLGWRRHAHWLILPVACLVVAVLTAATWLVQPPAPLTDPNTSAETVPHAERVEDQFSFAMIVNNEAAWKAVIVNFPDEQLFVQRARQRLALYYLRTLKIEKARPIYDELILAGANDPELMASGLAGQAVIYSYEGQFQVSNDLIANRLRPLRHHLDREMETLVRATIARNQRKLGIQIEDFFQDADPVADDSPGQESAREDSLLDRVLAARQYVPVVTDVGKFLVNPQLSLFSLFARRFELQKQIEDFFRETEPGNVRPAD